MGKTAPTPQPQRGGLSVPPGVEPQAQTRGRGAYCLNDIHDPDQSPPGLSLRLYTRGHR